MLEGFYLIESQSLFCRSWDSTKSLVQLNAGVLKIFFTGQLPIVATRSTVEDPVKLINI